MLVYRLIHFSVGNVSDKHYREEARVLYSLNFFLKLCCLWHDVEKWCRDEQAIDDYIMRRMRFICWITKTIDTHSEYVILIDFPRQQWLHERAKVLICTYIACVFLGTIHDSVTLAANMK